MKIRNFNLPQLESGDLDKDAVEELFNDPSRYDHSNKLSMRTQLRGTKKVPVVEWKHYDHGSQFYGMINRKLESYEGWNVDDARSDFYKWARKNRIPDCFNLRYEFDREFNIDRPRYCGDWMVENKTIKKKPLDGYRLRQYRNRYYNNVGHQLLGYQINSKIYNCPETKEMVYRLFGKYIDGVMVDMDYFKKFDQNAILRIKRLYNELHSACGVWVDCKTGYLPGKYYKGSYDRVDNVFEPVYSPDIWERKSNDELRQEWINNKTISKKHKAKKKSKKQKRELYDKIYEDGILKAKGIAARSDAENLVTIERLGFTKDSFKAFGGQPNL